MSDDRRPIEPTRIIPAAESLPVPAAPPPPPPVPPAPPGFPDPDPEWWRPGSGPSAPVPVDVHVHIALDQGGPLVPADPDPGPAWYQRIRIGYNLALGFLALGPAGPWSWVLASVRDEEGLAGAWVMALIPLVILGFLDNARQVEARCSNPDLWAPKLRAGLFRCLLWAAVIATVLTLPLTTLVYAITGVKPA